MVAWLAAIPAAVAIGKGIGGAIGGVKRKKRNDAVIGKAYDSGSARLKLRQGDERATNSENLVARGLAAGGTVNNSTYTDATVPVARDLAMQSRLDLRGEQVKERDDLYTSYVNARTQNRDNAKSEVIGSLADGLSQAASVYSSGRALQAANAASVTPAAAPGVSVPGATYNPALSGAAWRGIDPVDPFATGKPAKTTSTFNVYGKG